MTTSTTVYNRGDVVLVNFIFTDETGVKKRPAIIISSREYNNNRQEAIISAITSRTERILTGDYLIKDWKKAGLISPSLATCIIRTIKQDMISKKLGKVTANDLKQIDKHLKIALGIQRN